MSGGTGVTTSTLYQLQADGQWLATEGVAASQVMLAVEHESEDAVYGLTRRGELFRWQGEAWERQPADGPENANALVYDSRRGRLIVSVEEYSSGGGLYAYEGGAWGAIDGDVPGLGGGHGAAYDRDRDVLVVYGGLEEDYYCDFQGLRSLWEYDFVSSRWNEVPIEGSWPSSRYGHGMYFDAARGVTVVTSGEAHNDRCHACIVDYYPRRDVWEWDGVAWRRGGAAPGETGVGVVYDAANQRGILIGGGTFRVVFDTCEFDRRYHDHSMERRDGSWQALSDPVDPLTLDHFRMAYHPGRDGIIAHGGEWDVPYWPYIETADSSYLYDRSAAFDYVAFDYWGSNVGMAYDPIREEVVGFGGRRDSTLGFAETHTLGPTGDWRTEHLGDRPTGRFDHAMAWHPVTENVVMYGGTRDTEDRVAWLWDGTRWAAHPAAGPASPGSTAMAFDDGQSNLIVVTSDQDTWIFEPEHTGAPGDPAWTPTAAELPIDAPTRLVWIDEFGLIAGAYESFETELYRWSPSTEQWTFAGERPHGYVTDFAYDPELGAIVFASASEFKFSHWFPPCRVDLDCDGSTTIFDFLAFQTAFEAADPRADFDGDGQFTIFDFLAFADQFEDGCA